MKRNSSKIFIIAEAGINHNGSIKLAKKLVDKAVYCGADAIKFQTFKASDVISKYATKLNYQLNKKNDDETQLEMLKKNELTNTEFKKLFKYCKKKKIIFISTPKDLNSAKFLNKLGVSIFKIGSGDILNYELLEYVASTKKKLIISTGMCSLNEVKKILKVLNKTTKKNINLLHCVSLYPTPLKLINLNTITYLRNKFKIKCGFSDHTQDIETGSIAAALGAHIIEKHMTLNRKLPGPDHKMSLEPKDFKSYVEKIRKVEILLGKYGKTLSKEEKKNILEFRRGLVYSTNFSKNHIIGRKDLNIKRPLLGMRPYKIKSIIGKELKKNVSLDQPVKIGDFFEKK